LKLIKEILGKTKMRGLILTNRSVILCPHEGMIQGFPGLGVLHPVEGGIPLMFNDVFTIGGCYECLSVQWSNPSTTFLIDGIPALTHMSVGLCMGAYGEGHGTARICSFQTVEFEPEEITVYR
jgi:hypothetical protein